MDWISALLPKNKIEGWNYRDNIEDVLDDL